jgi:hypothetical protein
MLELARAIVVREQDVAGRELDVRRRRQELEAKERELDERRRELHQLRLDFSATAKGQATSPRPAPADTRPTAQTPRPSLARAQATIAQRVLAFLEMEPRALSPMEIFNQLELPPPIETLRATLWKMEHHNLIARPYPGHYCALQYLGQFRSGESAG